MSRGMVDLLDGDASVDTALASNTVALASDAHPIMGYDDHDDDDDDDDDAIIDPNEPLELDYGIDDDDDDTAADDDVYRMNSNNHINCSSEHSSGSSNIELSKRTSDLINSFRDYVSDIDDFDNNGETPGDADADAAGGDVERGRLLLNSSSSNNNGNGNGSSSSLSSSWQHDEDFDWHHNGPQRNNANANANANGVFTIDEEGDYTSPRRHRYQYAFLKSKRVRKAFGMILLASALIAVIVSLDKAERRRSLPDWEKELSEEGLLEKQKEQEEGVAQFERQKKGKEDGEKQKQQKGQQQQQQQQQLEMGDYEGDNRGSVIGKSDQMMMYTDNLASSSQQQQQQQTATLSDDIAAALTEKEGIMEELLEEIAEMSSTTSTTTSWWGTYTPTQSPDGEGEDSQKEEGASSSSSSSPNDGIIETPSSSAKWFDRTTGWKGHTYADAVHFCSNLEDRSDDGSSGNNNNIIVEHELCSYLAYCPDGPNAAPLGGAKLVEGAEGDTLYAPIKDLYNDWVQIGNDQGGGDQVGDLCRRYTDLHNFDKPRWGITWEGGENKDYDDEVRYFVMCCPKVEKESGSSVVEAVAATKATEVAATGITEEATAGDGTAIGRPPSEEMVNEAEEYDAKYYGRGNGWHGHTYGNAIHFCSDLDQQLCPYLAYCPMGPNSIPFGGEKLATTNVEDQGEGDALVSYAPIKDLYNDWVQIGNGDNEGGTGIGDLCRRYTDLHHFDKPRWGITGGVVDFVLCCAKTSPGFDAVDVALGVGIAVPDEQAVVDKDGSAIEEVEATATKEASTDTTAIVKLPSEVMAYKEEGQTVMSSATSKPPTSKNGETYTPAKPPGNNMLTSTKKYESTWYDRLFNTHHDAANFCTSKGPTHQLCSFDAYCPHGEHTFPHVPTSYNTIGYMGAINDDGRSWAPLLGSGDDSDEDFVQISKYGGGICVKLSEMEDQDNGSSSVVGATLVLGPLMCCHDSDVDQVIEAIPGPFMVSAQETGQPTPMPTKLPTRDPTYQPTSKSPTPEPTTKAPSPEPTPRPTTKSPTPEPTSRPTTKLPTSAPALPPSINAPAPMPNTESGKLYQQSADLFEPVRFGRSSGWTGQTHKEAIHFCSFKKLRLCPFEAYCPLGEGSLPYGGVTGDKTESWAPLLNKDNYWVQLGDGNGVDEKMCGVMETPEWGVTGKSNEEITRHVMCCSLDQGDVDISADENNLPPVKATTARPTHQHAPAVLPPTPAATPSINAPASMPHAALGQLYQKVVLQFEPIWFDRSRGWHGQSYNEAVTFCRGHTNGIGNDMILCPFEAYCPLGESSHPYGGVAKKEGSESWAPIMNKDNSWVQLGDGNDDDQNMCTIIEMPEWGFTGNENEEITRHVMCCTEQSR